MLLFLLGCDGREVGVSFGGFETGFSTDCAMTELTDTLASTLSPDGCGYMVTAFDAGEQAKLSLDAPAFADLVTEGTVDTTYTLPDDTLRFDIEVGCHMKRGWCGEAGSPNTVYTYSPTAGTLQVTGAGLDVRVVLTGLEVAEEEGEPVALSDRDWEVTLYPTP